MGGEIYRTKWQRDWGTAPSETLGKLLSKLTLEQIKQGFSECVKRAQDGKEWPPTPIEFISLCKMAGLDINGSFLRMINKQPPADEAEKQTRYQVGYNCRGMADSSARKLWAEYYRKNFALMKEGKLATKQPLALPEKVQTKTTDTMRDNFKPSTEQSAKMMQRINKLRGK